MTSLAALLEENKFLTLTSNNRIKCSILGHEMPPNLEVVKVLSWILVFNFYQTNVYTYLNSKKLLRAREWYR